MNATKEDVSSKLFNFLFRQPLLCTESQLRETFYNQGEESFLKYIYIYTDRSSLIDTLGERERERDWNEGAEKLNSIFRITFNYSWRALESCSFSDFSLLSRY